MNREGIPNIKDEWTGDQALAFVQRLVDGDPSTHLITIKMMDAGLKEWMVRKIEHHAKGPGLADIEAMSAYKTAALSHETDHIDLVIDAYEQVVEALDAHVGCLNINIAKQAETN